MKFLIHWLLVVFTILNPMLANAALTDYDRQELAFVNLLGKFNGGFESGKANWTASGGTFTAVTSGTNLLEGKGSFTWDASASGQTLTSQAVTIPEGYHGLDCEANILVQTPSGTASHYVEAFDGTNVIARVNLVTSTTPRLHPVNFVCPQSGTVALRLYANADEPLIAGDVGYIGRARNVGTARQAVYKGSLLMTGCTDWSVSNTSFASFSATAGCSYTATGDVLSPSTFIPGFRLQNVGPGRYVIMARGYFGKSVTTTNADISFRFTDGTNTFAERIAVSAASASGQSIGVGEITGTIGYTTAQSTLTFQLQGQTSSTASSTAAVVSDDGGANATSEFGGLQFEVFYFPAHDQTILNPNAQGLSWSGTHGQNCSWSTTSTSLAAIATGDASCTFTELSNRNFGTVASATASGNNIPGIVFTPVVTGKYFICATAHAYNASAVGNYAGLAIHDGTSSISFASRRNGAASSGTNDEIPFTMCGIATFSSIASRTVQIYANASAGTTVLGSGSSGVASVTWTIFNADQTVSALIANSVYTKAAAGAPQRISSYSFTCSSSASMGNNNDPGTTIGNIASGSCTITFGDPWSNTPNCTFNITNAAGNAWTSHINSVTTTTINPMGYSGGYLTTYQGSVICMGAD